METSDNQPKIAVVGCGYWGRNLVRNFHQLGALVAVADRDDVALSDMHAKYGVPIMALTEILADPSIDAVVISAPAAQHFVLAHEAMMAGKHVFVEKPLSLDVEEAEKLCALSEKKGLTLMVGHLLQYHPAFQGLKKICSEGRLGQLQYVYSHRMNLGKFRTEENILWSFAPHDISMILGLLGNEIETVTATAHCYLHKTVADVTTTHITFANGQAAHIHVSWLHPFKEQRLVVIGEKGMAVFDDGRPWPEKLCLYSHHIAWKDGLPRPEKAEVEAIHIEEDEPLRLECEHFLNSIATNSQPRTDGAEGTRVLRVLDAAQRSIETGAATNLRPSLAITSGGSIHPTAVIDARVEIGEGTRIWHFTHVLSDSRIGKNCVIGQNVMIGPSVNVGNRCKIQNNVCVYPGVTLEDGVFCGPSMVFTNVVNPRAEIERKNEFRPTLVKRGATIGANATIICGHEIGRYAMIGAGAVVTKNIPDFALVVGSPAQLIGYVCSCGVRLHDDVPKDRLKCPACSSLYTFAGDGQLSEVKE